MAVSAESNQGDWVLFQARSDLGPWLKRSAGAHTLMVGSAFALLLLVLTAQTIRESFPEASGPATAVLFAAAVGAALPLPLLMVLHGRRRVDAVGVDPQGLTLVGPRGEVRVPFAALREARASAEPAFGQKRPVHRGDLRDIPGFHAALELRLATGARYEFVSARSDDVAGVLAWMDVLGAGATIRREPSSLAARHHASDALHHATRALVGAVAAVSVAAFAQLAMRVHLALPAPPMLLSLAGIAIGCALYVGSYAFQLRAARAWLEARGLLGAPPGPAADAAALARLPTSAPPATEP